MKTSTGDEAPPSMVTGPEVIVISPESSPQRSPRPSPQHEAITHFLLVSVGMEMFTADITEHAGEEQQQGEHPEMNLDVSSSSTTVPEDGSPTRAFTDEPVRIEEEPASMGAGSHAMATDVAGGDEVTPQQTHQVLHLSSSICFSIADLFLSPPSSDLPPTDHMNVDIDIEGIAKDAAAEADRIAADEAARAAHEDATKKSAEEAGNKTSDPTDSNPAAGALGATPATRSLVASKAVVEDQPSTSNAPPSSRYLKVGDNLFVSIPGTASTVAPTREETFDEDIITTAGLNIVDEPLASSSGTKEEQLLKAITNNFRQLQALHRS